MARRTLILFLLLAGLAAPLGCQEARMAVPPDLAVATQVMKVEHGDFSGWDGPFTFGPFSVGQIHRGWTEATAWGFLGYQDYAAKQSYEFTLTGQGKKPWRGNCAANVRQRVLEGMVGKGKLSWELGGGQNLACTFLGPDKDLWKMALASSGRAGAPMRGLLKGPDLTIEVKGTDKLEGSPIPLSEATGYLFAVRISVTGLVGAVQVINQGMLWLPASPMQDALAAASTALLLRQNLERKH